MIEIEREQWNALGLQYVIDLLSPRSPYGAERARKPRFFAPHERSALEDEWHNIAVAMEDMRTRKAEYDKLSHLFMQVRDLRGTFSRMWETVLTELELFELKRFLLQLGLIAPLFESLGAVYSGISFTEEEAALRLLDPEDRRAAGFSLGGVHSKALAGVQEEKRRLEARLRAAEDAERAELLNARRLLVAREEEIALRVRTDLTKSLRPFAPALEANAEMIGRLDFILQRAELALARGMTRPRVKDSARFTGMINPMLSDPMEGRFTPVSIEAPRGVTALTGANMGGKSVSIKTLALNILLCHAGFYAFAESAETPLFDALYIVSGDLSSAAAGLSSFGAEVVRIGEIVRALDAGSFAFVALDEPARGTNPREGAAIARALVKRLAKLPAVTILATHYDGVADEATAHYQVAGLRPGAANSLSDIASHMDYGLIRVEKNAPCPQDALTICRLLQLDAEIIREVEKEFQA